MMLLLFLVFLFSSSVELGVSKEDGWKDCASDGCDRDDQFDVSELEFDLENPHPTLVSNDI